MKGSSLWTGGIECRVSLEHSQWYKISQSTTCPLYSRLEDGLITLPFSAPNFAHSRRLGRVCHKQGKLNAAAELTLSMRSQKGNSRLFVVTRNFWWQWSTFENANVVSDFHCHFIQAYDTWIFSRLIIYNYIERTFRTYLKSSKVSTHSCKFFAFSITLLLSLF